jgi:hypothetical protein
MTMPKGWKPSYANKSPEVLDDRIRKMYDLNHNEIELKKWMVEGIRYEIQAYKEALKSYKEKFDIFSEEWTSNLLNFRNSILAVISSVVIGAVSIAPFITIVNPLIIPIIIIGIFSASASYFFLSFWKFFGNRALNHIDIAFLQTIETLDFIDGFVAAGSFDLDILTARQLYIMGQFVKIVGSNRLALFDAYELVSKSLSLRLKQKELTLNANANLVATCIAYNICTSRKDLMQEDILKPLSHIIQELIQRSPDFIKKYQQRIRA